ncbi:MAG: hypothetical protein HYZ20_07880 [Burkholderiales bacterium]|nr:hypothetical protein [Burkholderiales bacterium]
MAAPWWLLGLLLLPLIRWLHRGGVPLRALPVAHLGLWPAATPPTGQGAQMPPDPAWRRRALLVALLLLALAGPRWPDARQRVTLWVDDAPAMLLRDAGATRLAAGLARAGALLSALGDAEVELRTLSDPWRPQPWPGTRASVGVARGAPQADGRADEMAEVLAASIRRRLDADTAQDLQEAGCCVPVPPPAALLRPERAHWLLTAGTGAAQADWPGGRGPERVIEVGAAAHNVGLVRLAARRKTEDPRQVELLAVLANGGDADETRSLTVTADGSPPRRIERRIAPGSVAVVTIDLPASASPVRATLEPTDALPEDDALDLDLAALRPRTVAADAACAPALRAALAVHPMLSLADPPPPPAPDGGRAAAPQAAPDAVVDCGGGGLPAGLPTLRLHAETLPTLRTGAPGWPTSVPAARRPRLDAGALPLGARLHAGRTDRVLLALGDEPVIVRRAARPTVVETSIDIGAAREIGDALPLLVALMVDELFGARLLEQSAIADRGLDAARVLPLAAAAGPPAASGAGTGPAAAAVPPVRELGGWLAGAAALVLGWEIAQLARRHRAAARAYRP